MILQPRSAMPPPAKRPKRANIKSRLGKSDNGQQRLPALIFRPLSAVSTRPVEFTPRSINDCLPPNLAAFCESEEWSVKHQPLAVEQLAVAKKKVQEIKDWLQTQLNPSLKSTNGRSRLLLLTGPPGCGKSTAVQLLAKEAELDLCEWQPAAATSWEECEHTRRGMLPLGYSSKLAEFADFASRAKMPSLMLTKTTSSKANASQLFGCTPSSQNTLGRNDARDDSSKVQAKRLGCQKLGVIEDLPHAATWERRAQLAASLRELASGSSMPVVVMATQTSGSATSDDRGSASGGCFGLHKDLIRGLEGCGIRQLHLNPITTAAVAKCLSGIAAAECQELSAAEAKQLAAESGGDLRSAVAMLQLRLCGTAPVAALKGKKGTKAKRKRGAATAEAASAPRSTALSARDSGLSLFHALGKLLYNKRLNDSDAAVLPPFSKQPPTYQPLRCPEPIRPPSEVMMDAFSQGTGVFSLDSDEDSGGSVVPDLPVRPHCRDPSLAPEHSRPRLMQGARHRHATSPPPHCINLCDSDSDSDRHPGTPGNIDAPGALGALRLSQLIDRPWWHRRPLQCDPERVLHQASLEATSVAAFLHENLPNFLSADGISSAAECFSYLSSSDCLTSSRRSDYASQSVAVDDVAVSSLADTCAAAVAARGVLFANTHPAPSRFHCMRAPQAFAVHRGESANAEQLRQLATRMTMCGITCGLGAGALAAQLLPFARMLTAADAHSFAAALVPQSWSALSGDNVVTNFGTVIPQMRSLSLEASSVRAVGDTAVTTHNDDIED